MPQSHENTKKHKTGLLRYFYFIILKYLVNLAKELDKNIKYERKSGITLFIEGIRNNKPLEGSLNFAWPITEAVNLYAAALRSVESLNYNTRPSEREPFYSQRTAPSAGIFLRILTYFFFNKT